MLFCFRLRVLVLICSVATKTVASNLSKLFACYNTGNEILSILSKGRPRYLDHYLVNDGFFVGHGV